MGRRYFDFSNFFPQLPENDETNGQLTDELAFYQHIDNRVREIKIAVSFKYYTK